MPDASDKGAGGDAIFTRDFSAPTGEDKMDKSVLPKARACSVLSGCRTRTVHSKQGVAHGPQGCPCALWCLTVVKPVPCSLNV